MPSHAGVCFVLSICVYSRFVYVCRCVRKYVNVCVRMYSMGVRSLHVRVGACPLVRMYVMCVEYV